MTLLFKILEVSSQIITDRVRSTRECNVYTWECLSVQRGGGVPPSSLMKRGTPSSLTRGGGGTPEYPPLVKAGWGSPPPPPGEGRVGVLPCLGLDGRMTFLFVLIISVMLPDWQQRRGIGVAGGVVVCVAGVWVPSDFCVGPQLGP